MPTVLFCQQCGAFQLVGCQLEPCPRCGSAVFHVDHPHDRNPSWTPTRSAQEQVDDAEVLHALVIQPDDA